MNILHPKFSCALVEPLFAWLRPVSLGTCFTVFAVTFSWQNGFCVTTTAADLQKHFEVIAKTAQGRVGVAVELLETKESILPNASTYPDI